MLTPKDIDVVILCGGLGRRLHSVVRDVPKPMAQIGKQPFLDILINYIASFGFRNFILCAGYMSEKIKDYYKDNLNIRFSQEKKLLGTGGAVKKVKPLIKSKIFLVTNGDSFCNINLKRFLGFHIRKNALASVILVRNKNNKEYGSVKLSKMGLITSFKEKNNLQRNYLVNAGIYLFSKQIFEFMPGEDKFSLEYDLLPILIKNKFFGYKTDSLLIDIGSPESLNKAKIYFRERPLWRKRR